MQEHPDLQPGRRRRARPRHTQRNDHQPAPDQFKLRGGVTVRRHGATDKVWSQEFISITDGEVEEGVASAKAEPSPQARQRDGRSSSITGKISVPLPWYC